MDEEVKPPEVLIIAGPTASGKTELALALARTLGGEVISADSRQVYRDLDAGTAKPRRDAEGLVDGIPYHLLDVAAPTEPFDAGTFARQAREAFKAISARGRLPIVAGGTGLYLRAFLTGLDDMPASDPTVRAELAKQGPDELHAELVRVDPPAAAAIPPKNIQRVLRALEVHRISGRPISSFWTRRSAPPFCRAAAFILDWEPAALAERIAGRARLMWPAMLAEAGKLRARYRDDAPGFQSLGYREAMLCAAGGLSDKEGLERLIRATLAYAKRQRTWFRHQLPGAIRIPGGPLETMVERALSTLPDETRKPLGAER